MTATVLNMFIGFALGSGMVSWMESFWKGLLVASLVSIPTSFGVIIICKAIGLP